MLLSYCPISLLQLLEPSTIYADPRWQWAGALSASCGNRRAEFGMKLMLISRLRRGWSRRVFAAAALLAAGPLLGGCAGTHMGDQMPAAVGGLPEGVPQRPETAAGLSRRARHAARAQQHGADRRRTKEARGRSGGGPRARCNGYWRRPQPEIQGRAPAAGRCPRFSAGVIAVRQTPVSVRSPDSLRI